MVYRGLSDVEGDVGICRDIFPGSTTKCVLSPPGEDTAAGDKVWVRDSANSMLLARPLSASCGMHMAWVKSQHYGPLDTECLCGPMNPKKPHKHTSKIPQMLLLQGVDL